MGYDLHRFLDDVEEELICPICKGVLENPTQSAICEHAYCTKCIQEWLKDNSICPVDCVALTSIDLHPVPRITRNLLSRLHMFCEFFIDGCSKPFTLEQLPKHILECEYNPACLVDCEHGCGFKISTKLQSTPEKHNCVKRLRRLIDSQICVIEDLQNEAIDLRCTVSEMQREQMFFKDCILAIRTTDTALNEIASRLERDSVLRWSCKLPLAEVARWSALIASPTEEMRRTIRRCISQSACPPHILDNLVMNCSENKWPSGLTPYESRYQNRRIYERYVCRRIKDQQAVVALACDNTHMPDNFMIEPGLVFLFVASDD